MEKELDANIIKATQLSLGKYVKRPPLSEKLLKKPPFRFLHDIVTSVLKSTGFFDGLFEDHELISDNVKDREAKISFLNKVIYVIGKTVGKELNVKPSKIVAGQEPEKTNEVLQCLAEALDKNLTSKDAIKSFRGDVDDKTIFSKDKKSLPKSKEKNIKNDKTNSTSNKRLKVKENKQKPEPSKNISQQIKIDTKETKGKNQKSLPDHTKNNSNDTDDITGRENNYVSEASTIAEPLQNNNTTGDKNNSNGVQEVISSELIENQESDKKPTIIEEIPSEANSVNITKTDLVGPEKIEVANSLEPIFDESLREADHSITEAQKETENYKNNEISKTNVSIEKSISTNGPSSVRPSSSRPSAPKVREKQDYRNLPDAETTAIGKVNIIPENALLEEDEESTVVIENDNGDTTSQNARDFNALNQHGHLVQQILDSQKEFTQANKTEIEWTSGSQKTKNDFNKEMEQLRFNVQALSRVANPLGKILDHIQEDVEVMRQELSQWLQVYDETTKKLLKQKALNEDTMTPLRLKSTQLDMNISEKQKKIDNLKIIVFKNNSKIERLLVNEHDP